MIYGQRSNGKHHGLVLTKPVVVDSMLDRVGYFPSKNLKGIKVIEPAAGDGAFAAPILKRLYESSLKYGFSFKKEIINLTFFELDPMMAEKLTERIKAILTQYSVGLPDGIIRNEDFLLSPYRKCDLIIGNPPYVRHENIPEEQKKEYRRKFKTFSHRSDLFIAFYEKGLYSLNPEGTLSFLCANRWLKNQYGKNLRVLIKSFFHLSEIIDLEKTNPFEEQVIAYPAITTIKKSNRSHKAHYYKLNSIDELSRIDCEIKPERTIDIDNSENWFSHQFGILNSGKKLKTIEDQGFKIGIGVATGCDRVFIQKDHKSFIEKDLLLPIITSRDLKNNQLNWSGNYILNPFDKNGELIDLSKYPKAHEFFEENKEILQNRHVAKRNPKTWYKTIDKIQSKLIFQDKILLPDISGNRFIFIDRGEFYPHHNLYYITGKPYSKLVLLAAVLMSDFTRNQLLELGNKMNGGYPRWQSQNLKKLYIPIIDAIPDDVVNQIVIAYSNRDYDEINSLIQEDNFAEYSIEKGQLELFEPLPKEKA